MNRTENKLIRKLDEKKREMLRNVLRLLYSAKKHASQDDKGISVDVLEILETLVRLSKEEIAKIQY